MKEGNWAQTRYLHSMIGHSKKNPEYNTKVSDTESGSGSSYCAELDPDPSCCWIRIQSVSELASRPRFFLRQHFGFPFFGANFGLFGFGSIIHSNPDPIRNRNTVKHHPESKGSGPSYNKLLHITQRWDRDGKRTKIFYDKQKSMERSPCRHGAVPHNGSCTQWWHRHHPLYCTS